MVSSPESEARRVTIKRRRKFKPDAEIVLICNPRAGGRWKELAGILDSEEAKNVRRIVTDSVEDIATAVAELGRESRLLCVYGGDGTVQRVLDRLAAGQHEHVNLALLGGGTMNVTSRWCGFSPKPAVNFRHVVRGFQTGDLLFKEVPILEIETAGDYHRGFTFGMGPIVRLLDAYENGRKGKIAALGTAAAAVAAIWTKRPAKYERLITPMKAELVLDGEMLPYEEWTALFTNVTGQINPGVEPFVAPRERDAFLCAAFAVTPRELSVALPMLIRGWLPIDIAALFEPGRLFGSAKDPSRLADPRYINKTGARLEVRTDEEIYTVDGEILPMEGDSITVSVGPHLKLAVGPGPVSGAIQRLKRPG